MNENTTIMDLIEGYDQYVDVDELNLAASVDAPEGHWSTATILTHYFGC